MRRNFLNSIRVQMLINIIGVLLILVGSAAYILFSTIRMQAVIENSFEKQRSLKAIQSDLEDFQQPLLEYLSSRSSKALAELLIRSQKIHGKLPRYEAIPADRIGLEEKEAYSLVSSYLDLADKAIEEKRGMDVARYTSLYGEMQDLLLCINAEIDTISNARLAAQIAEYARFIDASRGIQLWNLLFIIFISLFSFFLIINAVDRINDPMVKLSSMASEISGGNFDVADIGTTRLFEVDQVVVAFNLMKKDIRTYIDELRWQRNVEKEYLNERVRNMRMEEMIRRMELYTLQAQMNPHFLFNTLNTGIQLAIVEGAERTGEYMENLTKLFRHNLREKNVVVPLRHEIEGLESYFYILGVRFPKNLDLVLDCPQEILDLHRVPASILQPLVENCIVHAFKGREGRNSIVVRVYVEAGRLCLSVADNGCGMGADTVVALLHRSASNEPHEKVMGLENVIQRLYFFFPDDPDVIAINSRVDEGTEILVRIDTGKELCIPY